MVIARATGGFEENFRKIPVTLAKIFCERIIAAGYRISFYAVKIVAGVKVINPVILWLFTIPPGPVGQLMITGVAHRFARKIQKLGIICVFPGARQQCSSEEIGIVN